MWFREADQGMLPHPGIGNGGEPSAPPPNGQRDGREWALDRTAEDGGQPRALGRVQPAFAPTLPLEGPDQERKRTQDRVGGRGREEALRPRVSPSAA